MNIKTKLKNKHSLYTLVALIAIATSFLFWQNSKAADSITELDSQDETQKKLDELQKKADAYREIIEIKQKQGETLNNQLSITDASIQEVQARIDVSKQKIDDTNSQITRIKNQIREKEELILLQKELLSKLFQAYYEVNLASPVISYLNTGDIASFIIQKDRLSQTGDKISELVDSLSGAKEYLEKQNDELDAKKGEYVETAEKLQDQGSDLESIKAQKASLLAQTQGEEAKYQKLLEKIEAQKLELLSIDELYATSGLSADDFDKPDAKYYASLSWFYSQRDPKWANTKIGNSKSLLKDYGCAVSAVAMAFTYQGSSITPKSLAEKDQYFQWDLIAWPTSWKSISLSSSGSGHGNLSWSAVDSQLDKKNPVIVYIGKSGGKGGHYVVIHHKDKKGKYVVHDPYFGPNIFLDTTRALVGAMGTKTSTYMDQMIIYN